MSNDKHIFARSHQRRQILLRLRRWMLLVMAVAAATVIFAGLIPSQSDWPVWIAAGSGILVNTIFAKQGAVFRRLAVGTAVLLGLASSFWFLKLEMDREFFLLDPEIAVGSAQRVNQAGREGWLRHAAEGYIWYPLVDPEFGCPLLLETTGFKLSCKPTRYGFDGQSKDSVYPLKLRKLRKVNRVLRFQ